MSFVKSVVHLSVPLCVSVVKNINWTAQAPNAYATTLKN